MPGLDYAALSAATPSPHLVLDPELMIMEVNQAYLDATRRTRQDLFGKRIFTAFPDNPTVPEADEVQDLDTSLRRVLAIKEPDTIALQRYDIPVGDTPGTFEERWWSVITTPILVPDGSVACVIPRLEDVTAFALAHAVAVRPEQQLAQHEALEAELYARARDLQTWWTCPMDDSPWRSAMPSATGWRPQP